MATRPVVVVTGASRGIGLAVAEILLSKFKTKVLSLSRSRTPELNQLGERYPSDLTIVQCDITDESATASALATCSRIDALVLNAATVLIGRTESPNSTVEAWKQLFDVNFFSLLHTVRAALPQLRASKGNIIFVSSGSAVGNYSAWGAYNASKAAMNSFCRTLANEEPGITCVALRPGVVDTSMQQVVRDQGAAHMDQREHAKFVETHAAGKLLKPTDSGHVIAALALNATHDLSGEFVSWDMEKLKPYRAEESHL